MVSFGCLFNRQQRIASAWACTATCAPRELFWGRSGRRFHPLVFSLSSPLPWGFPTAATDSASRPGQKLLRFKFLLRAALGRRQETDFPWHDGNSYPGYQRFFLAFDEELSRPSTRLRPKAEETSREDLTETGNRAWKASGTQGRQLLACW